MLLAGLNNSSMLDFPELVEREFSIVEVWDRLTTNYQSLTLSAPGFFGSRKPRGPFGPPRRISGSSPNQHNLTCQGQRSTQNEPNSKTSVAVATEEAHTDHKWSKFKNSNIGLKDAKWVETKSQKVWWANSNVSLTKTFENHLGALIGPWYWQS